MGEKILVVDDEEPIRELLKGLLEREGYEPLLASNGQQALRLAESEKPLLVILDAMMPVLDGVNTCIALRANEKTRAIPIILATDFRDVLLEALYAGVDDFVMKPFELIELMVRVRGMLRVRDIEDGVQRAMAYVQELRRTLPPRQFEGEDFALSPVASGSAA